MSDAALAASPLAVARPGQPAGRRRSRHAPPLGGRGPDRGLRDAGRPSPLRPARPSRRSSPHRRSRQPAAGQPRREPRAADPRLPAELHRRLDGPRRPGRRRRRARGVPAATAGGWSRRSSPTSTPMPTTPRNATVPRPMRRRSSTTSPAGSRRPGTSLTEAVGLFVAARRPFLDELTGLGRRRALDAARLAALYEDASGLLDRLLLRLIATFQDDGRAHEPCRRPARPDLDPRARLRGRAVRPVARAARRLPAHLDDRDALLRRRRRLRGDRRGERLERGALPDLVPDRRGLDGRLARARDGATCWAGRGSATASRCASSWPACSRSWSATSPSTPAPGTLPLLYFIAAGLLALAVAVETYFANDRWPMLAAAAVVGATLLSIVLMATTTLPAPGYAVDPATGAPVATLFPPQLRLLTPFLNITGAFALILGAIFSTYVFMPKRRVLAYSLDPNQPGDEFLFNLLIAPVAIIVNLVASLPGAVRALVAGPPPQPRAGDDPDRDRGVRGDARRHAQPVRHDRVVPARQVPRRAVPVRRLPRLDRGLPRDPDPVHLDPPRAGPGTSRPAPRRWPPPRTSPTAPRPTSHRRRAGHRPKLGRLGRGDLPLPPHRPYHVADACPATASRRPLAPASSSSSWPRPCSGRSGRCRGSPTTPGWSRCRSSSGAARSASLATAVFVAWRIRRGHMRLTRLGDLDRGAGSASASRR